jgi:Bacterial dnaA protein helix-turn-helix
MTGIVSMPSVVSTGTPAQRPAASAFPALVQCPATPGTAAEVRAKAAHARAFRARLWPPQQPAALPAPPPEAAAALALSAPPVTPGRVLVRRVIKATAEHFGTTPDDLISARLTRPLTRHRQVAMYLARVMTGRAHSYIGSKIGDRHHSTIMHGVRAIKGLLDAGDAEMVAAVGQIMERLHVTKGKARP